jgi:membrane AbrB-like protein
VQTVRVVLLTLGLPGGLALFGLAGPTRFPAGSIAVAKAPGELALLVAASIFAALALFRLGFSGGLIFGPMLVSAVLHGAGVVHVVLPAWFINVAMVTLGTVAGSRFTNTPFRQVIGHLGAAFGSFAIGITVAAGFALLVAAWLSLRGPALIVAYAPGSVDVMMILALALQLDPVFVGAHHLARVFLVSLALPISLRLSLGRYPDKPKATKRRKPRSDGLDD